MEINSNSAYVNDEKLLHSNSIENDLRVDEEEEEEEALSLCDLPINEENQSTKNQDQDQDQEDHKPKKIEEEFDFGSWGGSVLTESEMCSADEIFFQGHILPYRCSVSSDTGSGLLATAGVLSRCLSRSESMEHLNSGGLYTSNVSNVSSRSSSIRSHNSSSSSCTSITNMSTKTTLVQNRFHSHPSPSPQIRVRGSQNGNSGRSSNKSSMWRFLQVGVVRTPDMEFEKLKLRRNTSSTSSIVGGTIKNRARDRASSFNGEIEKEGFKIERKKKQLGLFSGCKCSINSVDQTVHPRSVVIRSNSVKAEERQQHGMKKKIKQTTSRHRTFEWVKELSHAGVPDEA